MRRRPSFTGDEVWSGALQLAHVSSIRTTRSDVLETSARSALVRVSVLPGRDHPATRMLRRSATAWRSVSA